MKTTENKNEKRWGGERNVEVDSKTEQLNRMS